nr:hypothetical protein [Tanacetum cinerariifolium]
MSEKPLVVPYPTHTSGSSASVKSFPILYHFYLLRVHVNTIVVLIDREPSQSASLQELSLCKIPLDVEVEILLGVRGVRFSDVRFDGVRVCGVRFGVYEWMMYEFVVYEFVVYEFVVYEFMIYEFVVCVSVLYESVVYDSCVARLDFTMVYEFIVYEWVVYGYVVYESLV